MTPYYKKQLEIGLKFQDVVTRVLYQRGIVVVGYASQHFQNTEGENMLGAEIKRDGNFRKTGRLWIEYAEKTHPNNATWIDSGIKRKDTSWLYVIGDDISIWIFSKKWLKKICESGSKNYKRLENNMKTSRGYLLPVSDADLYCIRKVDMR